MRTLLFFDLPTLEQCDLKAYRKFIREIKKIGFYMLQESVYVKMSIDRQSQIATISKIKKLSPNKGDIMILTVTEKQFSQIQIIVGENKTDVITTDERLVILWLKKVYIKSLNELAILDEPIIEIIFDDVIAYWNFTYELESQFIYSEDNQLVDLNKKMIRINNPFVLEINNKKIIAQLYKKILKRLTDEQKSMISNIEMSIFKLLDQLLTEDEITLTYSTELNFLDILSICKVEFRKINYENYLEMLVYYLKIKNEYNHTSIIISNGLLNILTEEEIKLLEVELKLLGMNVIDISVNTKENKVRKMVIDEDWCIF